MNYVVELMSNNKENFDALIEISRFMSLNDFELLRLNQLKQLIVNEPKA